jgi:hypothetical protein
LLSIIKDFSKKLSDVGASISVAYLKPNASAILTRTSAKAVLVLTVAISAVRTACLSEVVK